MISFKRAIYYLKGNIGKTSILAIILLMSGITVGLCFNLSGAAQIMLEGVKQLEVVKYEIYAYNETSTSEDLNNYVYLDKSDLQRVVDSNPEMFDGVSEYVSLYGNIEGEEYYVSLFGDDTDVYSNMYLNIDTEKSYEFSDADLLSNDSPIILPNTYIERNNLKIGDTVSIQSTFYDESGENEINYTGDFTIVGEYYYEDYEKLIDDFFEGSEETYINSEEGKFLTTTKAAKDFVNSAIESNEVENPEEILQQSVAPYLLVYPQYSEEDVKTAISEIYPDLEIEVYNSTSSEVYNFVEVSSTFSTTVLLITSIIMFILVSMIVSLIVRSRQKEFGILISLGASKFNIISQVILELYIIMVVLLILIVPLSYITISNIKNTELFDYYLGYLSIEIGFNALYNIYFIIYMLVLLLISCIIPLIYMLRLNPKKILM